jgi:DNA-binding IclR family transcriptional regulator
MAQLSPAQARAFRLLAVPDGPDISVAAASAVLDLSPADTAGLLESLVDAHLLEPGGVDRYSYQEPLRMFARGHAHADDGPEATQAALTRLVRFYSAEGRPLRAGA